MPDIEEDEIQVEGMTRDEIHSLGERIQNPGEVTGVNLTKVTAWAERFFEEEEEEERSDGKSKGRRPKACDLRTKWTEGEEKEIEDLINLRGRAQPGANEAKKLISKSQRNGGVIHKRSVSALKNKLIRVWKKVN